MTNTLKGLEESVLPGIVAAIHTINSAIPSSFSLHYRFTWPLEKTSNYRKQSSSYNHNPIKKHAKTTLRRKI
ncbi:hypothetical protein [Vibrio nomapromontoriensis]|uniref:hypothetical protein n=1 Tax=Vibrio nomapromontoriensis TaxID=2910246 RepID=UPI003D11B937